MALPVFVSKEGRGGTSTRLGDDPYRGVGPQNCLKNNPITSKTTLELPRDCFVFVFLYSDEMYRPGGRLAERSSGRSA